MAPQSNRKFGSVWIAGVALLFAGLIAYAFFSSGSIGAGKSKTGLLKDGAYSSPTAESAWNLQSSGTSASLRGIFSVNGAVAWATGTEGTILRTTDGGINWRPCVTTGPDAKTLDFRAVQAWDANKALVMAAGPGDKSRIYRTLDGCQSWELSLHNEIKEGFWDQMSFPNWANPNAPPMADIDDAMLIGDPVGGRFDVYEGTAGNWIRDPVNCKANDGDAVFAASNSSAVVLGFRRYVLGIGGKGGAAVVISPEQYDAKEDAPCRRIPLPMAGGTPSSGVFSVAFRTDGPGIAVGGDYTKPGESSGTAAWTADGGLHWAAAAKPPHGYRSSVAWSDDLRAWIAAGTNGSDISRDDGKTWQPLDDGSWNSLSLPFVVGPKGRIARISSSLQPTK